MKRRCRKGRHRWGLWLGGEWHGLPHWHTGAPKVQCRYCAARGLLTHSGVHTISGVGAGPSVLAKIARSVSGEADDDD